MLSVSKSNGKQIRIFWGDYKMGNHVEYEKCFENK